MGARGQDSPARLTAAEFTARFQQVSRVLWTLAAGLLGDPAEAEDVCQEAFLAAYAKREQFDPATHFQAWMGRFIRNVVANELRKRARRATASTDPLVLDESVPAGEAAGLNGHGAGAVFTRESELQDTGAFDDALLAGLRELGEVPRSCLLLRTLRELSYAEIADLLAIPEGTAMSHVHRARHALRVKLTAELAPGAPPPRLGVQP